MQTVDQGLSNALFDMFFRPKLFENEQFERQCFMSFFGKVLARYGGSPLSDYEKYKVCD